ncbi:SDR family NAD(P)-dependent oxidoreductase (plasmid) [Streptomyces cellulosae]|uniref:type I polyketide synthase n=1 Tax=Streptomyces cellulosae TaxID=1968 RepID=UPI002F90FA4D|nr:SDR family NAD(P)-dependent oxidoreductase [Streptomyces cellulosae]WTB85967.1 SDR family NAD(P)-dependent oxidoreductase [Streptomyces cellulosae]WTB86412.1 SDR family NAD(P)-dependent oxidoreductase [Streptomyces cellulosae]WTB86694.1 SDR family NAD(P)-dependent oxidoreductase [Streptomyces cellulosae]WTB86803.1 SDR family NAD(P)-dependent oxidoreductase [Streptomyces cellulosae]
MNAYQPVPDGPDDPDGRIAIIGMAGRFPGAESLNALWELLASGREVLSRFTEQELRASGVPEAEAAQPGYVPVKGILDDIAGFDSQLFGYSGLEASVIDPQQRIFLECAWTALEDAGCDPEGFTGSAAVFAGSMLSTYLIHNLLPRTDLKASLGVPLIFQGNAPDGLAPRVAYKFNLRGPAVNVQTACSTSLVAVHMAAQSLLSQECDLALAGGVSVTVPHRSGYLPAVSGIESPDGHCRPFSTDANGTVFSNGAGVVVLKRLADALADGDRVHAVILGSAINNDGARRAGYTAPGVAGQTAVIREALSMAGVSPRTIGYVEAHGTGTPIGDPIEVSALTAAYRAAAPDQDERAWCALGSAKANLGHLDAAAGVSGLIKTVLTLQHGQIPAAPHTGHPHPDLGLADSPFFIPDGLIEWPPAEGPRRAAVSSFGIGGTNAHVILEQAPAPQPRPAGQSAVLPIALPISARTETALDTLASWLADHLTAHPRQHIDDIARTLRTGRRQLRRRRVVVAADTAEAAVALRGADRRDCVEATTVRDDAPVGFLLPGQGAQFPTMAVGLHRAHPVFRAALDECARLLEPQLGCNLVELLRSGGEDALRRTSVTQPAVMAVSWALSRLWEHWGVRPRALLGHSLGEYTAALLSGVLELPDALALVSARGRLLEQAELGAMFAVALTESDALEAAERYGLDLAAVNGPQAAVLSGARQTVDRAMAALAERGLRPVRLPVDRAFHSALCEPAAERFAEEFTGLTLRAPLTPFVSNLTGDWITVEQATDPDYWVRQMRAPVRFHDGVRRMASLDDDLVLVESGPGGVLTDLIRAVRDTAFTPPRRARPPLPLRGRRSDQDEARAAVLSLADLWTHGVAVRWEPLGVGARVTDLPGYPFERRPHWIEPHLPGEPAEPEPSASAVPSPEPTEASHAQVVWRPLPSDDGTDPLDGRRWTWLVLLDRDGLAQPLVDLLTSRGQIVTVVRPGTGYRRVRRGVYEIDPTEQAQYTKLLADLRSLVRTPTAVLYAWGIGAAGTDETDGYFGLVRLARAMSAESVVNEVRLGVLTTGAFRTGPGEVPDPAAALLSGPVQVLPEEYTNLRCTQLDLARGETPDETNATILVRTVLAAPAGLVALREGRLLGRAVEPVDRPVPDAASSRLRHGGTYLITGGLGGIGLALAGQLARTCAARLVLLGRRPAPEDGDSAADALRELRASGAEILTVQADVTDRNELAGALDLARERFGSVDGVVHAAGIPGGGSVELRTDEEMHAVLAPKTTGVRNLLAELRPGEAELLVLCSSLATLVPTYGQADYAAANSYLVAVAEAENTRADRYAVAVDWDMWARVGMASRAEVPADLRDFQQTMIAGALTPEQGARAFSALLEGPGGRAVVARAGTGTAADGTIAFTPAQAPRPTTLQPRPELTAEYVAPRTGTEQRLAEIYAELLGMEEVGVNDDFLDLGGHSLLAARIVARLRTEFGVEVPARVFFEGGRVCDLAVEIEELILTELEGQ